MPVRDLLSAAAGVGGAADPYFYDVSLLLTGDGTNGAQNNTFLDSSTNNFTITRNGNTTQGTFSPYGSLWSNYFDGSSYLSASASAGLSGSGSFTLEAWVFPTVISGQDNCIYETRGGSGWVFFINTSGTLYVYDSTAGIQSGSTSAVTANTWSHIALVKNGSTCTYYINGTASGTFTLSSFASATGVRIGTRNDATQNFRGYISNLRTVTSAVYTSNFTPSTTPLTAVSGTSLLTCQSNRFKDNSSNNFTLTVNGNTSVQRFSPFNPTAPYSAATIGGSGYFDGSGDWLSVSTASASGDLTMEFWVYPTTSISSGNYGLFAASDQRFGMITVSGNLYFLAASDINTSTPLPINTWSHVAISKNSGTIKIFLNGVQIASASNSNTATGNWRIASNQSGEIFPACYMSDVRYIVGTGLYTTAFTPPTAPLTSTGSQTKLLTNFTNAGIPDAAMMNDLETVGNAQVSTSVKKYGTGSLYFDGTGDWLQFPVTQNFNFASGNFTIECWINVASIDATYRSVFTVGSPTQIYARNGTIEVYFNDSDDTSSYIVNGMTGPANSISANTWAHIAVVRNGTTFTAYVNGVAGTPTTGVTAAVALSANGAQVGAALSSYPFTGYIDDLRITKGYARYTSSFTPPTSAFPTF